MASDQSGGSSDNGKEKGDPNGGGHGPWGSGPRRPWGQAPAPREPERDLEDALRGLRERFRFGGGGDRGRGPGGGARWSWPLLLAILVIGWIASGIYVVDEGHRAVVTRFGAFNRITLPGLHMHMPPPIEGKRDILFSRQQVLEIGYRLNDQNQTEDIPEESSMITGDRNIVDIEFRVIYTLRADSPSAAYDYAFSLRDPQTAIKAVAESAMREVIGQRHLESILTTDRADIERSVEALSQRVLDNYHSGIDIAEVNLLAARPPQPVVEAFNEVVRAGQDAQAEINRATQYQNEKVPRAQGDAAKILADADGYRQQVVHDATGEASRFEQIDGEYRHAPAVTRQRIYLETMERLYSRANTIILDQHTGAVTYLPPDLLRRPAAPGQNGQPAQAQPAQPAPGRN